MSTIINFNGPNLPELMCLRTTSAPVSTVANFICP